MNIIKEAQGKYGLSDTEIAIILGVSPSAISRYKSGKRVPTGDIVWTFVEKFYYKLRPRRRVK